MGAQMIKAAAHYKPKTTSLRPAALGLQRRAVPLIAKAFHEGAKRLSAVGALLFSGQPQLTPNELIARILPE
jgi:hypothetical protein